MFSEEPCFYEKKKKAFKIKQFHKNTLDGSIVKGSLSMKQKLDRPSNTQASIGTKKYGPGVKLIRGL